MPDANGIYSLKVIGTVGTQQHMHTLHFRSSTQPAALAMSEPVFMALLISTWQGPPRASFRALFSGSELPVQQYQVRKVCGTAPLPAGLDTAEAAGNQAGTGIAGEFNGDNLAPWLASVTTLRTGLAGRRFRGRNYFGGLMEPMVTVSTVSADRQSRMASYYTSLFTAFVDAVDVAIPAHLFVYSKTQAEEFPGTPCQNTGADVISTQVRSYLCTMKSRKLGSGI